LHATRIEDPCRRNLFKDHINPKLDIRVLFFKMATSNMPPQMSLFQVYLRLRPPFQNQMLKEEPEQWLLLEPPSPTDKPEEDKIQTSYSTHLTLQPPNDSRKRAIERFGFTKIFPEEASQLELFEETGTAETINNVLSTGRDGLIATLGVTGSGKVRKSSSKFIDFSADRRLEPHDTRIEEPTRPDTDDS
jgi:hypothetical protein